jgi:hypothetical protein
MAAVEWTTLAPEKCSSQIERFRTPPDTGQVDADPKVGTLLENIVVTEVVSAMLDRTKADECLGFACAFAMPPLSEWRSHAQATGISGDALDHMSRFVDGTTSCGP